MFALFLLAVQSLPSPLFVDETAERLPDVTTTCGSRAKRYILEVNGGGIALADFDADQDCDLVVVDGSTLERVEAGEPGFPPRLYFNDGHGRFSPAGETWSMPGGRWGMGGAAGDANGDGFLDLVVTEWGPTRLFLSDAGRGFRESTDKAGFSGSRWGTSAAWFDFNADGALDLFVANYLVFDPREIEPDGCFWKGHPVMCGPEGLTPLHDQMYRGRGDATFEEVTALVGMRPEEAGFALGVMPLDFDLDGDQDVFVANDSTPNHLWENLGKGTFAERGFQRGVAYDANGREQASMGVACGDLNGDLRPDLFITNFSGESDSLYLSTGLSSYRERAHAAGIAGPSMRLLGWGTAFHDFDLDGDFDIAVFNGHVYPQADEAGTDTSYAQAAQLYRNDGTGRFRAEELCGGSPRAWRASAGADLDLDGDVDLVAIELDGPVRLLRNTAIETQNAAKPGATAANHWLRVGLRGTTSNRFGLGARVTAVAGDWRQTAEVRTSGGFQSSVPPEVHFGLGPRPRLDALLVRWPSGREQKLEGVAADRFIAVEEPE